ncbi:MAG: hypothetical protein KJ572_08355 [Gammaproteobacteria bacterium]|nr:hypothetical protein [Sideroxydans sp.]MBU3903832.1 hypothetical protein [Gammaproteobacteria bacterium]MBU4046343.1 hypothetical protein [Gammaproteobacteria bacterium]
MNPLIQSWLVQSAVIFLILGSVAGMVIGALLLFGRDRLQNISTLLDRWISTRRFDRALERRITLDPWFYRHRQATGTLILAGALYILYFFGVQLDRAETVAGLARRFAYPQALAEALLDAMVLSALLGALGAIVAALFILFRPSMMRGFEEGANQWLSLRKSLKTLEVPRDGLEVYVERHARQVGIFLMLGGLYTLVLLLAWLGR